MDIVQLVIEKLLSWPGVLIPAILACGLMFRKPLSPLLARTINLKVGKEGLTIDAPVAASRQLESKSPEAGLVSESKHVETDSDLANLPAVTNGETDSALQQIKSFDVPPIVQHQEGLIRASLKKFNLDVNAQETVDLLVKHLAVTQLWLNAERIYRMIFGSQIFLLKSLNTSGGLSRVQLSQYYEAVKTQFPEVYNNYPFEPYLQFLLEQGLIATEDSEHYAITMGGKEFLKWIMDVGVPENKAF
jgi:hypothetical protein